MGSAVFAGAAMRAASPIHFSDHAGFQQSTRRGERNFMRSLILETPIQPITLTICFHALHSVSETQFEQVGVSFSSHTLGECSAFYVAE